MAEQFQTSFIPKKTVETAQEKTFSGSGLVLFVGILTLVISLVLAGGVFAYDSFLKSSVTRKEEQLRQQRDAFAPEVIREMARLSTKLTVAKNLLKEHVAVSEIFALLQNVTLQTVRFSSFSFSEGEQGIQVTMQGEGLSFTSVALQADEFAKNPNLTNSIFSGFSLDNRGNVVFTVTTTVNPSVVSYPESMERRGSASVETLFDPTSVVVPQDTVTTDVGTATGSVEPEVVEDAGGIPPPETVF